MGQTVVRRRLLSALLLAWLVVPAPALAHQSDSRIVTSVESVTQALPAGVVVEARAGISAQLVAANPTSTPLEVLARGGEPFLRISSAGVLANLASPDFYETSNPNGSTAGVPERVEREKGQAAPRFVQISRSSSWGWYDHRLHPRTYQAPGDATRAAVLARFAIPLRYGGTTVTAEGTVTFRPLLGAFQLGAEQVPAGLSADVLQGRLPGLLLRVEPGRSVTVAGRDGEPFLRFGPGGSEVNTASRTYVEDKQARGQPVPPPGGPPRWEPVAASSYSWLDERLRYPDDAPPEAALRAQRPTELSRWAVPVTVDGVPATIAGAVRWVPLAAQGDAPVRDGGVPGAAVVGAFAALVLAVALVLVRRRSRAD